MSNCSAKHNYATNGGVIQGNKCQINLRHCIFENNTADQKGGVVHILDSSFVAEGVTFRNNTASTAVQGDGGAIYAERCAIHALSSVFTGNWGAGTGGAIYIDAEVLKIFNTSFSHNNALWGGVIKVYNVREIQLNNSIFDNNFSNTRGVLDVTESAFLAINSAFYKNVAGDSHNSGILLFFKGEASFENCTMMINRNPGYKGWGRGGAILCEKCKLRISTSIFDDNEANHGKDIFLSNDLLTYLSLFKHSTILESNDTNFKQKAFQENILASSHYDDVMISESQYASGKNLL